MRGRRIISERQEVAGIGGFDCLMKRESRMIWLTIGYRVTCQLEEIFRAIQLFFKMLFRDPKCIGRAERFRLSQRPIIEFVEDDTFAGEIDEEILAIM